MVEVKHKKSQKKTKKPDIICSYNNCKQGIDLADQLANYYSPLKKSFRWFQKVAFDIVLNMAVTNAYILYNVHQPEN